MLPTDLEGGSRDQSPLFCGIFSSGELFHQQWNYKKITQKGKKGAKPT